MNETIFKSRDQEPLDLGKLADCRQNLLLLEERFGPLPTLLVEQIEGIDDLDRLRAGLKQVLQVASLDEFVP